MVVVPSNMNQTTNQIDASETYRENHPVDYCPSCNTEQDVNGIYRTSINHTPVCRATEQATWNRCERCNHKWINIHSPEPNDYPHSNLDDFARTDYTAILYQKSSPYINAFRHVTASVIYKMLQTAGILLLVAFALIEWIKPDDEGDN